MLQTLAESVHLQKKQHYRPSKSKIACFLVLSSRKKTDIIRIEHGLSLPGVRVFRALLPFTPALTTGGSTNGT
jgi:hypothetical protein